MNDDRTYLLHIRDSIEAIENYTSEGREHFLKDRKTQDAVVRNLEIIGEASKRLSDDRKRSRPDIPWKQIAGMRDRLIHAYFGVDLELVWEVVEKRLPALRAAVTPDV